MAKSTLRFNGAIEVGSLSASQSDQSTGLSFSTAAYQAQEIAYVIELSGGNKRIGTLRVINDGSNVNINDVATELGDTSSISFDADINTGNVRILYTSGGQSATMRSDVKLIQS